MIVSNARGAERRCAKPCTLARAGDAACLFSLAFALLGGPAAAAEWEPLQHPSLANVATTITLQPNAFSDVTAPTPFTATLESTIPVNGGTVTIGDGRRSCTANVQNSSASCEIAFPHAGDVEVVAVYSGDATHDRSQSEPITHTVQPASTLVAIDTQTPNPSIPDQLVTVTAHVALPSVPGPATGTISIEATASGTSCSIVLPATSCSLAFTVRGAQELAAHFLGNADFLPSDVFSHHSVNYQPVAIDDEMTSNEDQPFTVNATDGVLSNDEDPDGPTLIVGDEGPRTAGGIGGVVLLFYDGSYEYTPPPDANGDATFEYTPFDGLENSDAPGTVTIHVRPANDPPTIAIPSILALGPGPFGVRETPNFGTMTSSGPGEHDNPLMWHVRTVSDPSGLLYQDAWISLDGTLSTPLTGRGGIATLAVSLTDDGGTDNGGNDTSPETELTLTVVPGADLAISIYDDTNIVNGGATAAYEVWVRNLGPLDVTSARATFETSANLSGLSWTCAPYDGATCAATGNGTLSDMLTLPANSGAVYEVAVNVSERPELPAELTATIDLLSGASDFDAANDVAHDVNVTGIMQGGFDPPQPPPQ